jgi:hypothetical protein
LFQIVSGFYQRLGCPIKGRLTRSELQLSNASRVVPLPCKEETIRSFSDIRLLIIDEAALVPDDLYRAVRPMLATSGGRLICLSTPHGKRGFFYDCWAKDGSDWHRIEIPAAQIPRIKPAFLEKDRRALGDSWFRQEYCCSFEALEGLVYPDFARCVVPSLCEKGTGPYCAEHPEGPSGNKVPSPFHTSPFHTEDGTGPHCAEHPEGPLGNRVPSRNAALFCRFVPSFGLQKPGRRLARGVFLRPATRAQAVLQPQLLGRPPLPQFAANWTAADHRPTYCFHFVFRWRAIHRSSQLPGSGNSHASSSFASFASGCCRCHKLDQRHFSARRARFARKALRSTYRTTV